jgi:hypothetical protein
MVKDYQFFKESLNGLIQNSGLDAGVLYYILKDTLTDIERIYYAQINAEVAQAQKDAEKKAQSETAANKEEE